MNNSLDLQHSPRLLEKGVTWYALSALHEELRIDASQTNPAASEWLRRVGKRGGVKLLSFGKGEQPRLGVHSDLLPLVRIWVARRARTAEPRAELSLVARRLKATTEVFEPIRVEQEV